MHRLIPSYLQTQYQSSHPWYTESCGEAVALKQLTFSSWKASLNEGNLGSFHKARNKCVSSLRRARKQHLSNLKIELTNLSPSSKTWWRLLKSVSGVCTTSFLPSLQLALQPTLLVRRSNASILCLPPNLVSPTAHSLYPPNTVIPNCSWTLYLLHLRRWRSFWQCSTLILQLDRTASAHVS